MEVLSRTLIGVLGPLVVAVDGAATQRPGARRLRRLLTVLAAAATTQRTVSTDELLTAIYGADVAAGSRRALATEIWRARQILGSPETVIGGSVVVAPVTGAVTYTPTHGFSGVDAFDIKVCDTGIPVHCETLRIPVTVAPNVVSGPGKSLSINSGQSVTITILQGVKSASGQALGVPVIAKNPTHGTAKVNPDQTVTYTAAKSFSGTDSFTFKVCDTGTPVACLTRTVSIGVQAVAMPSAVNPSLPDTGGPAFSWLLGGGGALFIGLFLMLVDRRRTA